MTKRIVMFLIINSIIVILLYNIPVDNVLLENICIYKKVFGVKCWNCGMTRAFLSVLHCEIDTAIMYNKNVIIVFPMTMLIYLNFWYKFIFRRQTIKNRVN